MPRRCWGSLRQREFSSVVVQAPSIDTVPELGERYSNWGRWGPEDQLGTLAFVTPATVRTASGLNRS
jgi:hypothetical protein